MHEFGAMLLVPRLCGREDVRLLRQPPDLDAFAVNLDHLVLRAGFVRFHDTTGDQRGDVCCADHRAPIIPNFYHITVSDLTLSGVEIIHPQQIVIMAADTRAVLLDVVDRALLAVHVRVETVAPSA